MNVERWYARYMGLAFHIASWSKDPSSKHGCVLVDETFRPISFGYNGMPEGTDDSILYNTEKKYKSVIHAEVNTILNAGRLGRTTLGSTAFVTGRPCIMCTGQLIQAGIKKIIYHPLWDEVCQTYWTDEHEQIVKMIKQSKVLYEVYRYVDLPLVAHFKSIEYGLDTLPSFED